MSLDQSIRAPSNRLRESQASKFANTIDEVAQLVRNGDRIVTSGCGAAPVEFLSALSARTDLEAVYISHATAWGPLPHLADRVRPSHLRFDAYFLPAKARNLHQRGEVDYLPLTFALMESMYDQGALRADVVAVTCSPPDNEGFCSLGPFVSYLPAAIARARLVVGECSPNWPHTGDAARIHISMFDHLIDVARKPIVSAEVADDAVADQIAHHVISLVSDGTTIQIGRGAIPNAVARGLRNHRQLGVHSEMVSDWVVDLSEAGVITGEKKKSHRGRIVTSFMDGSERLYRFAHLNDSLCMLPIYEVNNPARIGEEPNFNAINSAVEVDLTGQINAESVDGCLISGSGGLLDFALGAAASRGGKFIIAMPSTAKHGTISRIAGAFCAGATITVPRSLAHFVITEHGIADLRGCNLRERASRLIAIADPKFRDELADRVKRDGERP